MSNPILLPLAFTTSSILCSPVLKLCQFLRTCVGCPSLLFCKYLACLLYLILTDLMNRSGGPEEAHNETSRRDQLTLNAMHMALVTMLVDKASDVS